MPAWVCGSCSLGEDLALNRSSPGHLMLASAIACLLLAALATWTALSQPWLGLALQPEFERGSVHLVAVDRDGPARAAPAPADLVAISGVTSGARIELVATDLLEEPDVFETYAEMAAFMDRQGAIAALLRSGPVVLELRLPGGGLRAVEVSAMPARPLADLPVVFWFQLLVGIGGTLISAWVWALRRDDWGARMFGLVGLSMLTFTFAAAVYSTRELALDAGQFRLLHGLNQSGALAFGAAMIALFLSYPRRLVPAWALLIPAAVFGVWLAAGLTHVLASPVWGQHLPTMLEMLLIVAAIGAQWWATRRDPPARAALRWLGLSVVVGAGAFVAINSAPLVLGDLPAMPQGYAFGFFLLIHGGLALGLRRYRLFELDEWAFRIMFYTGGLLLLIAVDALLILGLHLDHGLSLGLALLAVGFVYLPLRDVLWRRVVVRRRMADHELFRAVVDVAFDAAPAARADAWRDLLRRLFDPLEMRPADAAVGDVELRGEGLELAVPATGDAPALLLRYPRGGRGLFGPALLQLAQQLSALMRHAEASRDAYERGVAEERVRIARDLHDDVGARLLTGLHRPDPAQVRAILGEAVADIRTIVSGLSGERLPLARVIADLRHETGERLAAAGIALHWPSASGDDAATPLDYRIYKGLISVLREVVSNAIRHSGAGRVEVELDCSDGRLHGAVADDGTGLPTAAHGAGHGLANIARRITELGGTLAFPETARGTRIVFTLPLEGGVPDAAQRAAE